MRAGNNGGGRKKGSGVQGDRVYVRIPRDMKAKLMAEAAARSLTLSDHMRQILLAGCDPQKQLVSILRTREPEGFDEMLQICYPLMTEEESVEFNEMMNTIDADDNTTPVEWLHQWRKKKGLPVKELRARCEALAAEYEDLTK